MMISNIFYIPNKGSDGVECESIKLLADLGMEKDYHAVGGDKQLTIITKELFDRLGVDDGICFKRFKPNIVVTSPLQEGEYQLGDSVIYVSKYQKKCFVECEREDKNKCLMKHMIYYGAVKQSGIIKVSDELRKKT